MSTSERIHDRLIRRDVEAELNGASDNPLVDVSNGKLVGKSDLGDGYTRWDWRIQYPINNYNVSLNIGNYVHFSDRFGDLPLDFYVRPASLEGASQPSTLQGGRFFLA